jgi:hypothetical protein
MADLKERGRGIPSSSIRRTTAIAVGSCDCNVAGFGQFTGSRDECYLSATIVSMKFRQSEKDSHTIWVVFPAIKLMLFSDQGMIDDSHNHESRRDEATFRARWPR